MSDFRKEPSPQGRGGRLLEETVQYYTPSPQDVYAIALWHVRRGTDKTAARVLPFVNDPYELLVSPQ